MATIVQMRRGLASQWTAENPTLADGEYGYEKDTGKLKIGDGITPWVLLGYYQGVPGPPNLPNAPGALALRLPGLDDWFSKFATLDLQRAKIVALGDSISVLNNVGGFGWPWLVTQILSQYTRGASSAALGTRYTDPGAVNAVPSVGGATGVQSKSGTGGYCATLAAGDEITVSGVMDSVRVVYGTSATGGTINVYDGPSSGAVKTTVSAAGPTAYSNILEYTFGGSAVQRTVTIKVVGGTGTLVEQAMGLNTTLSANAGAGQGVDMVVCAHSGLKTGHFTPTGYVGSLTDFGDPTSHALAFINNFQPDLVINNLGYNDASTAAYEADQNALNAAILSYVPGASILTVMPYHGAGNNKVGMFQAAQRNAALYPGKISVISFDTVAGYVGNDGDPFDWSWDGAHPRGTGKSLQSGIVAAAVTGDPIGNAYERPEIVAQNPNIPWVGSVSGTLLGVQGKPAGTALTASRDAVLEDWGATLVYNGTSDITLTFPLVLVYTASGNGTMNAQTTIICTNTGKVTLAGSGGVVVAGTTTTTAANQRLDVVVAGTILVSTRSA